MSRQCIGTQCLHAGHTPGNGESRNIPIVQSTTFRYATGEQIGAPFDLEESSYFYTRLQNPTNDHVTARICALEGGTMVMLTSSGQMTSFYAIFNIVSCGEHMVCSFSICGGIYNLLAVIVKRMGIGFTFVDPSYTEAELEVAFRPETRAVSGETVANSALTVLGFEKSARVAHARGVLLIVGNAFVTPMNCHLFEWGASIVTHSTAKYMDGHVNTAGGATVDSGWFDWTVHTDEFPGLTTPNKSYHGVIYTERFGLEGTYITKATAQLMQDFGAIPAPMNAYLLNVGLKILPLRMTKRYEDTLTVARFLKGHSKVSQVRYPGLEGNPYYEWVRKHLPNGTCGVVSFDMRGGREAAPKLMTGLELASTVTHVADAKTCVSHPVNTTHRQMNDAELAAAGVIPDLMRFSVGIEDVNDTLANLEETPEGA